jgi:hypothetical protein
MIKVSQKRYADRARRGASAPAAAASKVAWPASGQLWLVLMLLCPQSALFIAFAWDWVDLSAYLEFHLGLCGAAVAFGSWRAVASSAPDPDERIAFVLQVGAWTTLAGPFGTFIASGLLVRRANASGQPDGTSGHYPALSRLELLHRSLLDRRLRLDHAHSVRPLLDVIIDGTQNEKFDALSLIAKRYVPATAPTLKRALKDKDGSVRVLAATVMARQHNACTRRIGEAQEVARAAPDAPGGWRELGRAHLDYAGSGLLEVSRAETEFGYARAHLARAERLGHATALAAARDVLDAGEPREAPHAP